MSPEMLRRDPRSRGIPLRYARDLRPLAAVPLAGSCTLAKHAASWDPPHRGGSPADRGGRRRRVSGLTCRDMDGAASGGAASEGAFASWVPPPGDRPAPPFHPPPPP